MTRRRKICFVTTVPMAVAAFLSRHIDRLSDDYQVFVISNFGSDPLPDGQVRYLNVHLARKISPLADLSSLVALRRAFRSHRFDAVHSVTPKAGLLAMLAARLAGVPIRIHWFTGQVWASRSGAVRVLLKSVDRLVAALASHLLADSPSQKDFLVVEGVCPAGAIDVIADGSICGVDAERFRPNPHARSWVRDKHGIPADAPVVLFLGRLNGDKGLREMAEAMALLDGRFPELHWLIVGPDEGGMVELIRAVAGNLGERLHIQGFTREPEAYMAAGDIFCLPSYREGFGSSVIEAAAVGLPSVASRIYGLTDAVEEGVSGLLVPARDATALADALASLLADPLTRRAMGEAARTRALERFAQQRVVEGLHRFYRGLLPV